MKTKCPVCQSSLEATFIRGDENYENTVLLDRTLVDKQLHHSMEEPKPVPSAEAPIEKLDLQKYYLTATMRDVFEKINELCDRINGGE